MVKVLWLGGNEILGVFVSCSIYRFNGIGMFVLKCGGYYKYNGFV